MAQEKLNSLCLIKNEKHKNPNGCSQCDKEGTLELNNAPALRFRVCALS